MDEIDQHQVRKTWCAATGQTLKSFHEEALVRHMSFAPGMDDAASLVGRVRDLQLARQAEADKQVGNKKNNNKK